MIRCIRCILPETYPGISFDNKGVCNFCNNYKDFIPKGEGALINYFRKAKTKKRFYDALVPISGGKDSTYILYLAKKVYDLNILAFTFDNGFFSDIALKNIKSAIAKTSVDHIFYKPNWDVLKRMYRATLLKTGELCSACGIGLFVSYLKISADWDTPLILLGRSPVEEDSYTPEEIYDINRFKAIIKDAKNVPTEEMNRFLFYPNLNPLLKIIYTKFGKFGEVIAPLYYLSRKNESEIGEILRKEMGWEGLGSAGYAKHFDCTAEPFSNFLREHRYGYSRRVCHYSNLIRMGEIRTDEALEMLGRERPHEEPETLDTILEKLELSRDDLGKIIKVKPFQYEQYCYAEKKGIKTIRPFYNRLRKK